MGIGLEGYAFGTHLVNAAIKYMLFKFEVRDALAHQAADAIVLLINGNGVAGAA